MTRLCATACSMSGCSLFRSRLPPMRSPERLEVYSMHQGRLGARKPAGKTDVVSHMQKSKARILIIDDEQQIRELLFDLLCEDYDCTVATSAEEALAILDASDFDLV